jgi:hypothetical protein
MKCLRVCQELEHPHRLPNSVYYISLLLRLIIFYTQRLTAGNRACTHAGSPAVSALMMMMCYKPKLVGPYGPEGSRSARCGGEARRPRQARGTCAHRIGVSELLNKLQEADGGRSSPPPASPSCLNPTMGSYAAAMAAARARLAILCTAWVLPASLATVSVAAWNCVWVRLRSDLRGPSMLCCVVANAICSFSSELAGRLHRRRARRHAMRCEEGQQPRARGGVNRSLRLGLRCDPSASTGRRGGRLHRCAQVEGQSLQAGDCATRGNDRCGRAHGREPRGRRSSPSSSTPCASPSKSTCSWRSSTAAGQGNTGSAATASVALLLAGDA